MVNLARQIEQRFPGELVEFLRIAGKLAWGHGQTLYLVGGAVRDLLLERPNLDLDLVVEGDAIPLARELARASGEKAVAHPRFGTAKFRRGEFTIDLVTARSETYARPGALPTVEPGTINSDLLRRDFSINALAIHLDPLRFGELVDPYGGKSDLEQGLIRILHQGSFIDDPTRILRALRYEQRLGFRLEQETQSLLRRNAAMMDRVSGERLRHELELILKEERPEQALLRAQELGALQAIHPSLQGNGWLAQSFEKARSASAMVAAEASLYLSLLVYRLSREESEGLIARLKLPGKTARTMRDTLQLKEALPAFVVPGLRPSSIYRLLERRSPQAILACAVASDEPVIRERLELFLERLRYVQPELDGNALQQMGVTPGPRLGRMLRALHEARLDQRVQTKEEEETLVRRWLAGEKF